MSNFLTGLAQLNPQVKRHNGGTTTLTLDQNGTTNATMLYVNGVAQTPGIDFNVSGATLTTTSTLPAGTNICTTIQYFNTGIVNTVADNAIGLGQMASGVDGNVISYDASGNPVAVATGSDGQVLTSAGAGAPPAFETLSTGSLTLISSVTASSSASIAFTSGISSTYSQYMFEVEAILPATDSTTMYCQMSTDGGSSYSAGTTYGYQFQWLHSSQASSNYIYSTGATQLTFGRANWGSGSAENCSGRIWICDPASSSLKTMINIELGRCDNGGSSYERNTGAGMFKTVAAVNAIKFYFASGNVASGTIRMFGLNKT